MTIIITKGAVKFSNLPFENFTSVVESAKSYSQHGFSPVPLVPGSKKPAVKWKTYSFNPTQSQKGFCDANGVALRLGQDHGGLVDIDLDSPEARSLASCYLPATDCIFGRVSAPSSHYIFRTSGAIKTRKYQATVGNQIVVFAEIRGDNSLTMFPPSIHPAGEAVRFEKGKSGLPSLVDKDVLQTGIRRIIVAALLARIWSNSEGIRQEMALALAGGMLRSNLSPEFVEEFILNVALTAEDEEAHKRAKVVAPTLNKIKASEEITGWPTLAELLGENGQDIVKKIIEGLDISDILSPLKAETHPTGELDVVLASQVSIVEVDWFWEGRIAYGTIAILDGDPAMGKSTICLDLAARQSAGLELPGGNKCDSAGVVVLSCEDNYDTTIVPRLMVAGADMAKISLIGVVSGDAGSERLISIPEDLPPIRDMIHETGSRLLIIDPLVAFISLSAHSHNDQQVRRALGPLKALAEETGVAIIALRHLTKKTGSSAMYRGGGSIGMIAAARTALMVGHDPYDPDSRILAVTKNNLAKTPQSVRYQLDSKNGMTEDGKLWEASAVKWTGVTNVTADQLVSEPKYDEAGALHDAVAFLQEELADGPKSPKEIFAKAEAEGISKSTLNRAKKALGIKPESVHNGKTITGWQWNLPENQSSEYGDQDGY